jgi:hypothetical protein
MMEVKKRLGKTERNRLKRFETKSQIITDSDGHETLFTSLKYKSTRLTTTAVDALISQLGFPPLNIIDVAAGMDR